MADKHELQPLPNSSVTLAETRSSLIARGRIDAATLLVREPTSEVSGEVTDIVEHGDPFSQYKLGLKYKKGDGVEKNLKEAVKWFLKAANQGYPPAQFNLGSMYLHGVGLPKDYMQAAAWLHKAVEPRDELGLTELGTVMLAQVELATMYSKGHGVAKDATESQFWFQKSVATSTQLSQRKHRSLPKISER